jgi:hypothetical protein
MRLLASVTVAGAVALLVVGPSQAAPCKPGLTKINGETAQVFCGPAHAVVHVGGQTLFFSQGSCATKGGIFYVNIGRELLPPSGPLPYFGVVKEGAKAAVSYRFGMLHDSILSAKIARSGRAWTFSGVSLLSRKPARGTFSCG